MNRSIIAITILVTGLLAQAVVPPPGSLAVRSPVGSASNSLVLGAWGTDATTAIIPTNCYILVCKRQFVDGRLVEDWSAPYYLGSAQWIACDAAGTVPGSSAKFPTLTLYIGESQAWHFEPPPPAPSGPDNGVTPAAGTVPTAPHDGHP